VEKFIDNLPGFPDNIRYDGEGRYWIALSAVNLIFLCVIIRKKELFFASAKKNLEEPRL